jgi:UDP-N-acetylmuramate dehydrogenase
LLPWLQEKEVAWRVIGHGSNILVRDDGFHGVIIRLQEQFASVDLLGETIEKHPAQVQVRVGCGCSLARLIAWCTSHSLSGTEFMVGIPGTVGGAIAMNGGAFGREIGELLQRLTVMDQDGNLHELASDDLEPTYRHMHLVDTRLEEGIFLSACLHLRRGVQREITECIREHLVQRKRKQPGGVASAGSFFKNPPGDSAGRLIDATGLKGISRGAAMVSPRHANFLVNTGRASATDILQLMEEVQLRVFDHTGIRLEPEVQVL